MASKLPAIAVDLDDVLFDFVGHFFAWHNQRFGTDLQPQRLQPGMKLWETWGGTQEEGRQRVKAFFRDVDMLRLPPVEGAQEALEKLSRYYRLQVISARDGSSDAVSRAWIERYFPGVFEGIWLDVANPLDGGKTVSKAEKCLEIGARVLIDDQVIHAPECARLGIRLIVLGMHPWNMQATQPRSIEKAVDWREAAEKLLPGSKNR